VDLPSDGSYQITVLYASTEPRPLHFFVNGLDVKEVCGLATGGWGPSNRIGLASQGPFPPISMLRIFRME
jgi:hypothetical protein